MLFFLLLSFSSSFLNPVTRSYFWRPFQPSPLFPINSINLRHSSPLPQASIIFPSVCKLSHSVTHLIAPHSERVGEEASPRTVVYLYPEPEEDHWSPPSASWWLGILESSAFNNNGVLPVTALGGLMRLALIEASKAGLLSLENYTDRRPLPDKIRFRLWLIA